MTPFLMTHGSNVRKSERNRLDTLYVTLPNYVRIVYGYVPTWATAKS